MATEAPATPPAPVPTPAKEGVVVPPVETLAPGAPLVGGALAFSELKGGSQQEEEQHEEPSMGFRKHKQSKRRGGSKKHKNGHNNSKRRGHNNSKRRGHNNSKRRGQKGGK